MDGSSFDAKDVYDIILLRHSEEVSKRFLLELCQVVGDTPTVKLNEHTNSQAFSCFSLVRQVFLCSSFVRTTTGLFISVCPPVSTGGPARVGDDDGQVVYGTLASVLTLAQEASSGLEGNRST